VEAFGRVGNRQGPGAGPQRSTGPDELEELVTVTGIITAIIVGLIIGALARLVLPGKQNISIVLTIIVGIVAALIGTALARAVGVSTTGFSFLELVIQVIVAVIGVGIVGAVRGRAR
jgi:uncharacterized membrane protein YeaQ/YmgE (transglycosylase-associated protein family)